MLGQEVATLVDGIMPASKHTVDWSPNGLGSGVYFMRILAQPQDGVSNFVSTRKLLFLK
jgi:hypothetical protein